LLQWIAVGCSGFQCVAVCVAVCCIVFYLVEIDAVRVAVRVAMDCSGLQWVSVCCSVCCSVLQCVLLGRDRCL